MNGRLIEAQDWLTPVSSAPLPLVTANLEQLATTNQTLSRARAGNQESEQIELLEAQGERLDLGATGTASTGDQALAPVGNLNRPTHR